MKTVLTLALAALASPPLAGCGGPPDVATPSPVAAPKIARDVLKVPAGGKYPLDTCVVSGEKLGAMGDPYVITHEGVEVRFCCPNCEKEFRKDPAKYLAMIRDAKPR